MDIPTPTPEVDDAEPDSDSDSKSDTENMESDSAPQGPRTLNDKMQDLHEPIPMNMRENMVRHLQRMHCGVPTRDTTDALEMLAEEDITHYEVLAIAYILNGGLLLRRPTEGNGFIDIDTFEKELMDGMKDEPPTPTQIAPVPVAESI